MDDIFADCICKYNVLGEILYIFIKIALKFVHVGPMDNNQCWFR